MCSSDLKGHRKGVYWLTYFRLDSEKLADIQRRVQITEEVVRTLFLKVDRRIVEMLVAHAKAGTTVSYSKPEPAEGAAPVAVGAPQGEKGRHPAED